MRATKDYEGLRYLELDTWHNHLRPLMCDRGWEIIEDYHEGPHKTPGIDFVATTTLPSGELVVGTFEDKSDTHPPAFLLIELIQNIETGSEGWWYHLKAKNLIVTFHAHIPDLRRTYVFDVDRLKPVVDNGGFTKIWQTNPKDGHPLTVFGLIPMDRLLREGIGTCLT